MSIKYLTPSGFVEKDNFTAYSHNDGTIIKFDETIQTSGSSWQFTAVLDSGEEYLLHFPPYEDNYYFWENKQIRPHEFLAFMNSVELGHDPSRPVSNEHRCDNGMYGPVGYNPVDGIKPTPLDFSLFKSDFAGYSPVLGVSSVSHIVSLDVYGIDMTWRNWPGVTLGAKTLSGMLRQLCEWRELHIAGIAEHDYAEDAHNFIDALGLSDEMIAELKNSEVPMPTERFFRGYGNPRHGFSETGSMPLSIKNHLKRQLFYRNLSVLEAHHPQHPPLAQELKTQEKALHQTNALMFAARRMPQVLIKDITPEKIYDCYYMRNEFEGTGMMVPLSIDMPIMIAGLQAARFFDAIS